MKNDQDGIAERYLTEVEVAKWLNLSVRTLQGWRLQGHGPAFIKLGRCVRYSSAAIQTWVCVQERASTSALAAPGPCNRPNCDYARDQIMGDRP